MKLIDVNKANWLFCQQSKLFLCIKKDKYNMNNRKIKNIWLLLKTHEINWCQWSKLIILSMKQITSLYKKNKYNMNDKKIRNTQLLLKAHEINQYQWNKLIILYKEKYIIWIIYWIIFIKMKSDIIIYIIIYYYYYYYYYFYALLL